MNKKSAHALMLATAAASLFASGLTLAADMPTTSEAKVHCGGVNSCKGSSDCKTAHNACKGQNSCKGQGFLALTKAECDAKGGKVIQ